MGMHFNSLNSLSCKQRLQVMPQLEFSRAKRVLAVQRLYPSRMELPKTLLLNSLTSIKGYSWTIHSKKKITANHHHAMRSEDVPGHIFQLLCSVWCIKPHFSVYSESTDCICLILLFWFLSDNPVKKQLNKWIPFQRWHILSWCTIFEMYVNPCAAPVLSPHIWHLISRRNIYPEMAKCGTVVLKIDLVDDRR